MKNSETSEILTEEIRLDRVVNISTYLQCLWISIFIAILCFKPDHYKEIAMSFAGFAFLASMTSSRIYIRVGKIVENLKTFSEEEAKKRKKEYFLKFFPFYWVWGTCITLCTGF